MAHCARRGRAWDCGAGSGQATRDLAPRFAEVVATDTSVEQLGQAPTLANVLWVASRAEAAPIRSRSIDLIAVAQALHWFDHDRFFAEVRRVAAPGALFAAWTYAAPRMEGDVGVLLRDFMFGTLNAYWPPERKYVDDEYRTIDFPFERIPMAEMTLENAWSLDQLVGYMRSWSATARYQQARGVDPVIDVEARLRSAWSDPNRAREIRWPLIVVAGRVGA
jgi:ubiquinone/menaquinone biosynthesis C-methylase UbiE